MIETYAYGTSKDLIRNKEKIKRSNIKKHNLKWPKLPDQSYRRLIIGASGSRKTNASLNLVNHEPDIEKSYLYAEDPYKTKYQLLINKREST